MPAAFTPPRLCAGESAVPVSGKVYGASDMRNLVDSSLDFWLTTGRFNEEFEKRLAARIGVAHALTTNSGSSANLLALSTLTSHYFRSEALKPGDEVITVATGFPTTVNPVLQYGLTPVFVDVDIPTYNIKPEAIEAAVSERTRAIMVAHTLGNPFDLGEVMRIAEKYNLWVIEDCCDALGATYDGKPVGTFGDIGTLSFYPAHHITMGEGGAVFTDKPRLKRVIESMRDWGRDCWCAPG
jgi:CDP-6-deoxy-D-xylo-4-hexulose-3-dehydrase